MRPVVLYSPYATSSHEKPGKIKTFAQFEEENLVRNESNAEEDKIFFFFQLMIHIQTMTLMTDL